MRSPLGPVTTLIVAVAVLLAAPAGAGAKLKVQVWASVTDASATVTAVVSGTAKAPSAVRVTYGKTTVALRRTTGTKARSAWRSAGLTGARRAAVAAGRGGRVRVAVTIAGKRRTLTTTSKDTSAPVPSAGTPPAGTAPGTPAPAGPSAPASLFGTPAAKLTGQDAAAALQPYLVDSRFTDCVAGWPNCAVEHRYGIFASGDHYYCRLTSTSGSDINAYASNLTITGAEQETSGAWALSYAVLSYGDIVNCRWDVTPAGAATGQYWGPGVSTAGPASEVITGMQWVRGARDCSY